MARPKDPNREKRGTGHHPTTAKPKVELVRSLPVDEAPPPPEDLPHDVHELWRVSIAELQHKGLRPADYEAIRLMCLMALRARQASDHIATWGLLVEGERGPLTNPMIKVERDASMTYLRIAQDFGLTFASRLRLGLMRLSGESLLGQLNRELDEG